MQISKAMSSFASRTAGKVGNAVLSNTKKGDFLRKTNKFLQGKKYNPGQGAYYALMFGAVIIPRLLQAREPDEFREIFTRDITSVLVILFAMKGLKTGFCSSAQKKSGIAMVNSAIGNNTGKFKKFVDLINPAGSAPLSTKEITARYSEFANKKSFENALQTLSDEGGSIAKMFNIENQEGIFAKIKNRLPMFSKSNDKPLYEAAVKIFGEDFVGKTNEELLDIIRNINPADGQTTALEGLESLIGTEALGIVKEGKDRTIGLLNNVNNPITTYAKNIKANFEWISLGITAGALGFGLPKINEKLTAKRHLANKKQGRGNNIQPQQPKGTLSSCVNSTEVGQIFKTLA